MNNYFLNDTKKRQYLLFLMDIPILSLSIFVSYLIKVFISSKNPDLDMVFARIDPMHIVVLVSHLFTLYLLDQYNLDRIVNTLRSSIMLVLSVGLAGGIISGIFFFSPEYIFGRQVLVIHMIVVSFFMVVWRFLFAFIVTYRVPDKKLAVVGDAALVLQFVNEIANMQQAKFKILHICVMNGEGIELTDLPESAHLYTSVNKLLDTDDYDILVVDSSRTVFSENEICRILNEKHRGKAVFDFPTLYKNLTGKVPLDYIDGKWLVSSYGFQGEISKPYVRVKRIFDIIFSSLLMVVFFPLFLIIAIVIKLSGKGGIIFSQERIGFHQKPFNCLKFRTMIMNAEKLSGPVWSANEDPRVTSVGKFLRKTRLDELPQLWNILMGDISFVGPRPIRKHFADQLEKEVPFYLLRFSVQPGLSGWAQIHGCYAVPYGMDALQYELFYIQNMSLFLDLFTIFKTAQSVFNGEGK